MKMNKQFYLESLQALDESIHHWKENVKPKTLIDISCYSCACCRRGNELAQKENYKFKSCDYCSIKLITGDIHCYSTSYYEVSWALRRNRNHRAKRYANHMLSELYEIRRAFIAKYCHLLRR